MSKILKESQQLLGVLLDHRFVLDEVIGIGGLSTVFRAHHINTDLNVAVKVLHSDYADTEESVERFKREAKIINVLNHDNIVGVISFGVIENEVEKQSGEKIPIHQKRPFLALELLDGVGLDNLLDTPMNEREAFLIMKEVLLALEVAHQKGIIHRDIKPSNVMILTAEDSSGAPANGSSPRIKLLDFGIAKCNKCHDRNKELTQPGVVFGSPLYMSPEQCMGRDVDHRTDIYSLGCMYYRILTGVAPFEGENAMHTFAMHMYEEPKPISVHGTYSPEIETLVMRCLDKNPNKRWQSVTEMITALDEMYAVPA